MGYVVEVMTLLLRVAQTPVGRLAGALAAAMVAALAMGLSSTTINMATGLDPQYFPYARAFLAPLTGGYILVLALFATFVLTITLGAVAASLHVLLTIKADIFSRAGQLVEREVGRQLLRLIAATCMVCVATDVWNNTQRDYGLALESLATNFVYTFELYPRGECIHSNAGEAPGRLGSGSRMISAIGAKSKRRG